MSNPIPVEVCSTINDMEASDSELFEQWCNGDAKAGQVLFGRYYDVLDRFFINKISSDPGDLVQETLIACVKGRDRLQQGRQFRSYLFAIAYNILNDHLRKTYRRGEQIDVDQISLRDLSDSPSTLVSRRREQRLLLEGLRNIPIAYQVILELHYWEKLAVREMSEILDLPSGTVKSRLRRARELLSEAMTRLAQSPELLRTTLTRLDDWAESCRRLLDGEEPGQP
ncbi:MAG: sigma-70 family RNA polymerase sigma factor [Proteobacteria bacterium]|nr:sigma-70 family RNA polymerase sigma factor [Pseudomonadota bacterium]